MASRAHPSPGKRPYIPVLSPLSPACATRGETGRCFQLLLVAFRVPCLCYPGFCLQDSPAEYGLAHRVLRKPQRAFHAWDYLSEVLRGAITDQGGRVGSTSSHSQHPNPCPCRPHRYSAVRHLFLPPRVRYGFARCLLTSLGGSPPQAQPKVLSNHTPRLCNSSTSTNRDSIGTAGFLPLLHGTMSLWANTTWLSWRIDGGSSEANMVSRGSRIPTRRHRQPRLGANDSWFLLTPQILNSGCASSRGHPS